jgi:hypothetical protein
MREEEALGSERRRDFCKNVEKEEKLENEGDIRRPLRERDEAVEDEESSVGKRITENPKRDDDGME